jgi:hypothetical protein
MRSEGCGLGTAIKHGRTSSRQKRPLSGGLTGTQIAVFHATRNLLLQSGRPATRVPGGGGGRTDVRTDGSWLNYRMRPQGRECNLRVFFQWPTSGLLNGVTRERRTQDENGKRFGYSRKQVDSLTDMLAQ